MPTRAVFHCQFCDAVPDHGTQRSLAGQVSERMFGEYLDAFPGRWLVWNGGGPLGPRRYACREHRGDLVAYLRYHYATIAAQVWKMPPYPARWPDEKRPRMGGSMGIIKFGLRGGLLQDRPPGDAKAEPASDPIARGDPRSEVATPVGPTPQTGPGSEAGSDAAPPPDEELAEPAGETGTREDIFPPSELLGPDEWYPADGSFPPGDLFLPLDGRFAAGAGSASPLDGEGDDPAWPPIDGSSEDDDGPWPTRPDSPPA